MPNALAFDQRLFYAATGQGMFSPKLEGMFGAALFVGRPGRGSTPTPLRQATTVRPSGAAEQLPFWNRLPGRQAVQECAKAALERHQPEVAAVGVHDVRP